MSNFHIKFTNKADLEFIYTNFNTYYSIYKVDAYTLLLVIQRFKDMKEVNVLLTYLGLKLCTIKAAPTIGE